MKAWYRLSLHNLKLSLKKILSKYRRDWKLLGRKQLLDFLIILLFILGYLIYIKDFKSQRCSQKSKEQLVKIGAICSWYFFYFGNFKSY